VKVGDLVKYSYHDKMSLYRHDKVGTGIIVDFDGEWDPIVRGNRTGVVCASWRKKVEVISESR